MYEASGQTARWPNQTLTKIKRRFLAPLRDTLLFSSPHAFVAISWGVNVCVRTWFVNKPEATFRQGPFAVKRCFQGHQKQHSENPFFFLVLSKHERSVFRLILSQVMGPCLYTAAQYVGITNFFNCTFLFVCSKKKNKIDGDRFGDF